MNRCCVNRSFRDLTILGNCVFFHDLLVKEIMLIFSTEENILQISKLGPCVINEIIPTCNFQTQYKKIERVTGYVSRHVIGNSSDFKWLGYLEFFVA